MEETYKPRPFKKLKQEVYLLAKELTDEGKREDGDILYDAYQYLSDYERFLDKMEHICDVQRRTL